MFSDFNIDSALESSDLDELARLMFSDFNIDLFRFALHPLSRDSISAKLFLQKLIQLSPDEVTRSALNLHLSANLAAPLVILLLTFYNRHQLASIRDYFSELPPELVICQIATFLRNSANASSEIAIDLLLFLESNISFPHALSQQVHQSLEQHNARFVTVVLDFIEKHS
jgi:hypothetical protein